MAHLLNIVKQQQQMPIDKEKLRQLCFHQNIWDHFGVSREEFSALPEAKHLQLLRKFYFELEPSLALSKDNPNLPRIDSSISSTIKNFSSLTMTKVIENGGDKSQLKSLPLKTMMVEKRALIYGLNTDISGLNLVILLLRTLIYLRTLYFILTKATSRERTEKRSTTQTFLLLDK